MKIENMSDVFKEVDAVFTIDLFKYIHHVSDNVIESVRPNPEGYYLNGSIEPVFRFDKKYFVKENNKYIPIDVTAKDFFKNNKSIYDWNNRLVFTAKQFTSIKRYLVRNVNYPVNLVNIAVYVVIEYLNSLNRNTSVSYKDYDIYKYVKNEFAGCIADEVYQAEFSNLLDDVQNFVGKHTWCFYFVKVNGFTLVIERGIDYRIYKYYELIAFKNQDDTDIE